MCAFYMRPSAPLSFPCSRSMVALYEFDVLSAVSATPTAAPVAPIDNTFGAILIGNYTGLL